MRPTRIKIKNFGAYRDLELDLSSIHMAAVVGPNGAGKSTLAMDAVTWALYGQARSDADSLVSLGENECSVELDFLLGERPYRVLRNRRRGRDSSLQFQAREGDAWKVLNGKGIRETQDVIVRTLRLSYNTFVSASYFQQGDAGRFTTATPADRKQVLAEILGLDEWGALTEEFRELALAAKSRVTGLNVRLTDLEARFGEVGALRLRLQERIGYHEAAVGLKVQEQEKYDALRAEEASVRARRAQREALEEQIARGKRAWQVTADQNRRLEARLKECRERAARAAAVSQQAAEHAELVTERERLNELKERKARLELQHERLARKIDDARAELKGQLRDAGQHLTRQKELAAKLEPLKKQGATARKAVEVLDGAQAALVSLQERLQKVGEQKGARLAELRQAETAVGKAVARLDAFRALGDRDATCPTCGSVLSPEQFDEHLAELTNEVRIAEAALGQARADLRVLRETEETIAADRETLEQQIADGKPHRERLAQLRVEYAAADEAAKGLAAAEEAVLTLQHAVENACISERSDLAATEEALGNLVYDAAQHLQCQTRIAYLAPFVAELPLLQQAERDLPGLESEIMALTETLNAQGHAVTEDEAALVQLSPFEGHDLAAQLAQLALGIQRATQLETEAAQAVGAARQELATCEAIEPELTAAKAERDREAQLHADYVALAAAAGRNGVQALLIEGAIPEIEREANALLERMGGGLSVRLVTQREKKSGDGASETLDIIVSDALGERPIALFSGGEQFRVSFALRVAASRLLATRAGASIETLVIDEGVGCLDGDGQDRFVECVQAVADVFSLCLIVTHIEEMKTRFGSQVVVTKGPQGSEVQIV